MTLVATTLIFSSNHREEHFAKFVTFWFSLECSSIQQVFKSRALGFIYFVLPLIALRILATCVAALRAPRAPGRMQRSSTLYSTLINQNEFKFKFLSSIWLWRTILWYIYVMVNFKCLSSVERFDLSSPPSSISGLLTHRTLSGYFCCHYNKIKRWRRHLSCQQTEYSGILYSANKEESISVKIQ